MLEHFIESSGSDTGSSSQSLESPSSSSNANDDNNNPPAKAAIEAAITFSDIVAHFRQKLISGHGEAILYLGLDDDEIDEKDLLLCLDRLDIIASEIPCKSSILHVEGLSSVPRDKVKEDSTPSPSSPPTSRRKTSKTCSASVLFRLCPESMQDLLLEIRVAVVGNVDAGKSTTLGVLTKGTQDDGRGKAREDLFRHKHEATTGRTSSVGLEIMGFDAHGNVIGPPRAHPFLNESVVTVAQALGKVERPVTNTEKDLQTYRKMPWDSIMLQSTKVHIDTFHVT